MPQQVTTVHPYSLDRFIPGPSGLLQRVLVPFLLPLLNNWMSFTGLLYFAFFLINLMGATCWFLYIDFILKIRVVIILRIGDRPTGRAISSWLFVLLKNGEYFLTKMYQSYVKSVKKSNYLIRIFICFVVLVL